MTRYVMVVTVFLLRASGLLAQDSAFQQGSWQVAGQGGIARFRDQSSTITTLVIDASPQIGWFVKNRLMLMASLQLHLESSAPGDVQSYGAGPGIRYFFGGDRWHPFLTGTLSLARSRFAPDGLPAFTILTTQWLVGGGVAWIMVPHVALTGEVFYTHSHAGVDAGRGSSNPGISVEYGTRFGVAAFVF